MINDDERDQATAAASPATAGGGRDRWRPIKPLTISATRARLTLPGKMAKKASLVAAAIGLFFLLLISHWSQASVDDLTLPPEVRFRCGLPPALCVFLSTDMKVL